MSPSPLPEFPISASPPTGTIIQISVSQGGVPKLAVPQAHVTPLGLEGDRQAHPEIHGGPNRAVCLWSLEVITALQQEGHPIAPGCAGENITLAGLA
jgi:MOSC domain-containing protein YiiM